MVSHQKYMLVHVSVMLCPRHPLGGEQTYKHILQSVHSL
jgi:hypothetical protein